MSLAEMRLQSDPRRFGLLRSVWKLLVMRMRIAWNVFKRSKTRSKVGRIIVMLIIVGGMAFLYWLSTVLLRFLQSPELAEMIDPQQFLRTIPTLVLTMAFFVIIFTNFGVLLQALYLSRDMDFLVTKPVPMRAVFLSKLLEGILPNFGLFCAFSLPVLFGLGSASNYTWLFYPLLLLLLAALALAAGGLASILVMAVVRVVPARRVAEVLGFLGATVSILCGQTGNIINWADVDQNDVAGALGALSGLNMPWSPLAWAGRGLDAVGRGEWLPGLGLSLLSLALAGLFFAGTLLLAENLYYTGWAAMQGAAGKKRAKKQPEHIAAAANAGAARQRGVLSWLPRPVRGLMVKDAMLLRRDPRNLSQFITPLIVGVVMLFSTARGAGGLNEEFGMEMGDTIQAFGLLALSTFVGWMLMFSLGTLAFSREGKNYWLVRVSPVRPAYLLAAKFLVSYIPTLAFGLAYIVFGYVFRGLNWGTFPYAALTLVMLLAGATGIALAFGVAGANLEWDSPQRQKLRGSSGCFVFLAVAGFQMLDLALFQLPPGLWLFLGEGQVPIWLYLLGGVLGTAAAALAVFIPLRIVAPRLHTLGEG